jgi:DNA (cytosine-5)-methyltransferase 1
VANTNIKGLEGWKEHWKSKEELLTRKVSGSKPAIWKPEPELGRVANGIPNRVDRLKSLGNSIVPQLAQVLIQTIKDIEDENI